MPPWSPFWHVDPVSLAQTPAYGVMALFTVAITGGMELLSHLVTHGVDLVLASSPTQKPLPYNPTMHLDELETIDKVCIGCNKALTVVFVYHLAQLVLTADHVKWALADVTVLNTAGALAAFFLIYDLGYATFHWILHWPTLYRWVHKHHHRQISPTRGNYDAINVHPFEFLVGEYNHYFVVWLVPCHVLAVAAFIIFGGVLASLNHTRLGFAIPFFYDVRNHDVHHRWPRSNYGQYTMFWDKAFGWYRDYEPPKIHKNHPSLRKASETADGSTREALAAAAPAAATKAAESNKAKAP